MDTEAVGGALNLTLSRWCSLSTVMKVEAGLTDCHRSYIQKAGPKRYSKPYILKDAWKKMILKILALKIKYIYICQEEPHCILIVLYLVFQIDVGVITKCKLAICIY